MITAHYGSFSEFIEYNVWHSIVEEVIEGMLAQDKYDYKLSKLFKHDPHSNTFSTCLNKYNFEIIGSHISLGSFFRLIANMILNLQSKGVLSYVGFVSEEDISRNIRALTSLSLQHIGSLLSSPNCWAY